MKRFILGVMSFAICLILGQAVMANASVKVYHQRSTALINHPSRLRMLNNSKVKYIRVPRTYTHMRRSHKENQMTAVRGKKVTFRTHFFIALSGKGSPALGQPAIHRNV
ncbi:hypothetical protein [Secundilactobacillus silagei]|uniref:hypothetical protein n=1 Tax=Secundilactobacillus silagei TaxID=1293415 RepID=UPI000B2DB1C8|nr:hypothetical protein [Secundilactobacillus silagei]